MSNVVYVFGHQNPDTDSICSSISYSYLKQQLDPERNYIPVALKTVNAETEFVLNYFEVNPPKVVKSLKPQVLDINLPKYEVLHEKDSLKVALQSITSTIGRVLPVVDDHSRLIGILSISDIVPSLIGLNSHDALRITNTPIKNILGELELSKLFEDEEDDKNPITGDIHISTDLLNEERMDQLKYDDIVICHQSEVELFYGKVGIIIVGDVISEDNLKHLQDKVLDYPTPKITTRVFYGSKTIFEMVKVVAQSTPISQVVSKEGLEYFVTYETIDDVKENMLSSRFRRFPVVTEKGIVIGMISRSDLVDINKKQAILVDHNERGQSIEGIEDIEILEIIDHHRVADVSTIAPLYFRVEPVGCTCTIVAKMYEENNVEIPKHIAGLMMSAIISDTLLFNSPTCTPLDKEMALKLADIIGIDIKFYGMRMIQSGSNIQNESPEKILSYDRKKFMFGKYKVSISQVNTGDYDGFFKIYEETIEEMNKMCESDNYNLVVLLVTDVVVGGTEMLAVGDSKWIAENAFELSSDDNSIFLPGVFSRKKQVVPRLMNAARL